MSSMRQRSTRGSSLIEFTLIGIPLIFVLIGIFEIARAMWIYATLAHALKEANRYAAVHGPNCWNPPNSCGKGIRDVAAKVQENGVGLEPEHLNLFFSSSAGVGQTCYLNNCLSNGSRWPPSGPAGSQFSWIEIRGHYQFRSALAFFWPGAGTGSTLGMLMLPASSRERIQF